MTVSRFFQFPAGLPGAFRLRRDRRATGLQAERDALLVERRTQEAFDHWLRDCDTLEALCMGVAAFMPRLIPEAAGAIFLCDGRGGARFETGWNGMTPQPVGCLPDRHGCGLGRAYLCRCGAAGGARNGDSGAFALCLPLRAHGERHGLLQLRPEAGGGGAVLADAHLALAQTCADRIATAVSNLMLRARPGGGALIDPLTGLLSRDAFLDRLDHFLHVARRTGRPVGVVSLALCNVQPSGAGTARLAQPMAATLLADCTGHAAACRTGDAEFAVFLPGLRAAALSARAQALRSAVSHAARAEAGRSLSVLCGTAEASIHGSDPAGLLAAAQAARAPVGATAPRPAAAEPRGTPPRRARPALRVV